MVYIENRQEDGQNGIQRKTKRGQMRTNEREMGCKEVNARTAISSFLNRYMREYTYVTYISSSFAKSLNERMDGWMDRGEKEDKKK